MSTSLRSTLDVTFELDLQHISVTPDDIFALTELGRTGVRPGHEDFGADVHLNEIIPKPWGYEFRAFVDDYFDLWSLHIDAPHGTSMHVHPRKLTYLICLSGRGRTRGLGSTVDVSPGTVVRIAPGAFHSTTNVGSDALELVEVELPRNKYDLMRLADNYNRAGTSYESGAVVDPGNLLERVPYLPQAFMRARDPGGRYGFELRTGMDLYYRRNPEDLFAIPLCVSGVVRADLDILVGSQDPRRPSAESLYLCIRRTG